VRSLLRQQGAHLDLGGIPQCDETLGEPAAGQKSPEFIWRF
jgi:hypothetical protein